MTNPATPTPGTPATPPTPPRSGGGMPKWLIILLVVLLVVILGCCGGFAACGWACKRAAQNLPAVAQRAVEEAQRKAEEARRQAEQNTAGRGTTAAPDAEEDETPAPTPAAPASGGNAKTSGGSSAAPGGSITLGGGAGQPTVNVGGSSLPANFPKDVPVMTGFAPGGMSVSDTVKGSGMTMLSGKTSRQDAAAYYQKQMKDQGWTQSQNMDINGLTMMLFTKDKRQATIQLSEENGTTQMIISYEQKP